MTPEEFAAKMLELATATSKVGMGLPGRHHDPETAHAEMDELMCSLLKGLGYGAGVEVFEKADKWYA